MGRRVLGVALLAGAFTCAPVLAAAQRAEPPPASAPPAADAPATSAPPAAPANVIPAGALVSLAITEPLSSSKSKSGDRFGLKLVDPIVVGGAVLMPAGAVGEGEVIDAKPANIGGRPGRLVLAAHYIESGGVRLTLQSFKLGGGGKDRSILAVDAMIAFGIAGALVTGGAVEYPPGTLATAKVAADVTAGPPSVALPGAAAPTTTDPKPSP